MFPAGHCSCKQICVEYLHTKFAHFCMHFSQLLTSEQITKQLNDYAHTRTLTSNKNMPNKTILIIDRSGHAKHELHYTCMYAQPVGTRTSGDLYCYFYPWPPLENKVHTHKPNMASLNYCPIQACSALVCGCGTWRSGNGLH